VDLGFVATLRWPVLFVVALAGFAASCSEGGARGGAGKEAVGPNASGAGGNSGTGATTGGSGATAGTSNPATGGVSGAGGVGAAGPAAGGAIAGGGGSSGSSGASGSSSDAGASGAGTQGGAGASPGGSGGTSTGGSAGAGGASNPNARKLILRDEGLSRLTYVDLASPETRWSVAVPVGRDLQLVGGGRVMLGTDNGYEERLLTDGSRVAERASFAGTQTAHRLRNGNTLLAGVNWQGGQGIVIVEVNPAGTTQRTISYGGFDYVRLVRQTPQGTFMVTSNPTFFEGRADGSIVWQASVNGAIAETHCWKALRLQSGEFVVSTGYVANLQIFGGDHRYLRTISGPSEVAPYFFSDFQVLANGNFVVTNWQGHGTSNGTKGRQLLEFTQQGALVWSWAQDPAYVSSLQAAIVLDGLDTSKLHVEDTNGTLVPVP
jgi:hypothetical protein